MRGVRRGVGVRAALDELAFADDSVYRTDAMQVLEEWWIPGALYRPRDPVRPND